MGTQTGTKKGLLSRFRKGVSSPSTKKRVDIVPDERESSPSLPAQTKKSENLSNNAAPRPQSRVVSPDQSNNPQTMKIRKRSKLPFREDVTIEKAPPAREAAFGGPPRYDWIDIVSRCCSTNLSQPSYLVAATLFVGLLKEMRGREAHEDAMVDCHFFPRLDT